jgi:hypothetical protein
MSQRDDPIARIDDPVEPNLEGLKGVPEAVPSTERLRPDAVVVSFRKPRSAENRLALVVEDVPSPAPVPLLPVFDEPPHDLDVLFRHRPPSIPLRGYRVTAAPICREVDGISLSPLLLFVQSSSRPVAGRGVALTRKRKRGRMAARYCFSSNATPSGPR